MKFSEGDICYRFMETMCEGCCSNAHKVMKYMDEKGPLEDYDFSKDEMSDEELATLQLVLQTLKSVRATDWINQKMHEEVQE